jgi:hypothetical protein
MESRQALGMSEHIEGRREDAMKIACYWCGKYELVQMWWGRPLCPKCKAAEAIVYERD